MNLRCKSAQKRELQSKLGCKSDYVDHKARDTFIVKDAIHLVIKCTCGCD